MNMNIKSIVTGIKNGRSSFLKKFRIESQTLLLVGVFAVLIVFFSLTEKGFLTTRSITSMGFQLPEIGLLSLAMMITILIGGINLSVNATANLAAVLAGFFMVKFIPQGAAESQIILYIALALLIALLVGFISGALNGLLVGYIGASPILATLATLSFYTGISVGLTKGRTVTGFPEQLSVIGSKTLLGIPIPFLVYVLFTAITYLLLNHTTFGFKARMLGSNPTASNFSGIDNKAITMRIYILSGIIAAISGILVMGRTMSAAYEYGATTYVLLAILIAMLAGINAGFGNVIDVFISATILQILSTGFHMMLAGVRGSSFFKDFSWGILLITIFVINYFTRGRKARE